MIARFLVNAVALAAAAWLVPGITLDGATWQARALPLAIIAVLFGLVNAVVKPVAKLVSFPLTIVTLGLSLWVINAAMLMLTAWLAHRIGVGFSVSGWGPAFSGAFIVAIVGALMSGFTRRFR